MSEYKMITVANKIPQEPYYTFHEFFKSLGEQEILILGTHPNEYGGLGSKPRLLYQAIKLGYVPEKYLIFCDCFDIVFATSVQEMFNKYKQFNSPFVISSEKNCFPATYKEQYDKLPDIRSPYGYVNSGMIIAETEAMLTVLEAMDAPNIPNDYWDGKQMINPNDQEYYQEQFLKQPVKMVMDSFQILCNTLHDVAVDELDFTNGKIYNKVTRTHPCAFHFNGGAKTGGYLAFHDTGKHIKPFKDYQGAGDKEDADMYISVRKALNKIGLLRDTIRDVNSLDGYRYFEGWELIFDAADETDLAGGICVFKKVPFND